MTQNAANTLLVIPNEEWSLSLEGHLMAYGFAPLTRAVTVNSALDLFYEIGPQLVIIDLQTPGGNVVELCTRILLIQPAIKVVLVAAPDEEPPQAALHAGVSGCIDRTLPLTAWPGLLIYVLGGGRIFGRNVLQAALTEARAVQKHQALLTIGALQIDLAQRQVRFGERRMALTPREFSLLVCLARNADHVVSADQLLSEAWGYDYSTGTAAQVRLYIARLRNKLMHANYMSDFILTERGIGYRLDSHALRTASVRSEHRQLPPV